MQTLVLSVVSLWILAESSVNGALNISYTGSNKLYSTDYVLKCDISAFTGLAAWSRDGTPMSSCTNSMCFTTSSPPYTFRQDSSAIYVDFSTLESNEDGIQWTCEHVGDTSVNFNVQIHSSPISQMSTSIATEGTTSINSISEVSNITLPMISDSTTTVIDISASTSSLHNIGTTNFHSNTEYAKTETSTSYADTETSNFDANTQTNEIQTNTLRIISNSISTYQSMFVTIAANDISGSLDSTSQMMTETFALLGYSSLLHHEKTLPSKLKTSNVFLQTFSVSSTSFLDTLSDDLVHNIHVSSGSLITTEPSKYSILSMKISPLMSTTLIDPISYSSKMEDPSFSSHQYLSESSVTLPKISVSNQLPSAIIDTMNHFLYTTNTLITSYLDDTRHSFDDVTDGYQTFSQDYAASASTSLAILFNSTDHHYLSLQTTEYNETMQREFTSYVTTPLCDSHTDSAATGIYSKEKVTSGKSCMHTSVMPSQTQLASTNNIQDSRTDFEPYSQSNDKVFSSESSDDLLSTLQSTSLLLQFNRQTTVSELDSIIKPTNMSTFKSQSGILTMDLSLFTNPSSIQISTVLLDFKTTLLTTTINGNSKIMPSKIKSSSKQTNNGISYNEIETSFEDSLFSLDSFSGSLTSNDKGMTSLSSGVYKSISTLSTNTIQSGLSEKNKTIIFISTSSVVLVMIVVILLIIFAKVYKSKFNKKPPKLDNKTSWSNNSIPPKTAFPDYSFTGKSIYPLLNTSSLSFKMFHYEQHWNDIV